MRTYTAFWQPGKTRWMPTPIGPVHAVLLDHSEPSTPRARHMLSTRKLVNRSNEQRGIIAGLPKFHARPSHAGNDVALPRVCTGVTLASGSSSLLSLDELTEKQREVVHLLLDDRSTKEIARIIGISPSAVEQRLKTIRHRYGNITRRELQRSFRASDSRPLGTLFQPTESEISNALTEIQTEGETPEDRASACSPRQNDMPFLRGVVVGFVAGALTCCATVASTCMIIRLIS